MRDSALEWVIVRAVALADRPATARYSAGPALRVSPFRALAYADCAKCLLDATTADDWVGKVINVGR